MLTLWPALGPNASPVEESHSRHLLERVGCPFLYLGQTKIILHGGQQDKGWGWEKTGEVGLAVDTICRAERYLVVSSADTNRTGQTSSV